MLRQKEHWNRRVIDRTLQREQQLLVVIVIFIVAVTRVLAFFSYALHDLYARVLTPPAPPPESGGSPLPLAALGAKDNIIFSINPFTI